MTRALSLLFAAALFCTSALAQTTTTTYIATSGTVSPGNEVKANLSPSGSFDTVYGFGGPNCYYGTCDMPFTGHPFIYSLPDGTTASFNNFAGTADFRNQADVVVTGDANTTDSTGAQVSIHVQIDWKATCRSGRGGGCTKTFLSATLAVTK